MLVEIDGIQYDGIILDSCGACSYVQENRLDLFVRDKDSVIDRGYKGKNIHECLYQIRDDRNAYNRRSFQNRINESYVRKLAIKTFHLPVFNYIFVLRPIVVGLMPNAVYDFMHKKHLSMKPNKERRA